ncbi:BamA/TamA family outer membrane protein [Rhodohalobacter halophilus]|uniref:BamA/TamA family outer membrane protein n=1 Tax=Rhodohalobacter halophilus TaxID=1812810 RepID=UPI00114D000E|nr:BamA/TamA family outer membrane protein [Rhodohalobacter halophilus]
MNIPDEEDREGGVHYSIVPVLGYSSDSGFIGGGLMQRFNYGDGISPFLSNLKMDAVISTKGDILSEINYQRTRSFGTDIRSEISIIGEWYRQAHYFGIGNKTEFSDQLYDEKYFMYEKQILDLSYRARKTVADFGFEGTFDLYADMGLSLMDATERDQNTLFAQDNPLGDQDHRVITLGFGVITEDRDSEFNPTEGYRYEAGLESSGSFTFSEFDFTRLHAELRHYVEILPDVVIAQKITGVHILGEAPFWKRASLGDKYGLRGYHYDRFLGKSSILHVLEARTWLFSILDDEVKFGGQLFWDSGRVFSEFDSNGLFDNWKHSWGVGGAISLFNPDFIVRGDLGFSSEAVRIYAGVGYIF